MTARTADLLSRPPTPRRAAAQPLPPRRGDRLYNPLTDRCCSRASPATERCARCSPGWRPRGLAPEDGGWRDGGWLVHDRARPERAFLLKYVSLEAHTVCNQACYFCPVSVAPREHYFMPIELYERIVGQLAAYRHTIEAVFMINYNEPTADPRFVDQVRTIRAPGCRRRC